MAWKFEITRTTDVPVVRTTQALPLPWQALVADYEAKDRKADEKPNFTLPIAWWLEERGLTADAKNEKGELILTQDNMAARIKAAFVSYRSGIEKQRGDLVPWGVVIEPTRDEDGNWSGHRIFLTDADIDARKAAIARGKELAASGKAKKPAKKTATKRKAA